MLFWGWNLNLTIWWCYCGAGTWEYTWLCYCGAGTWDYNMDVLLWDWNVGLQHGCATVGLEYIIKIWTGQTDLRVGTVNPNRQ